MNTYRLGSACCAAVFGLGVLAAAVHDDGGTSDAGPSADAAVVEAAAPLPTSPSTIATYEAPSTTNAAGTGAGPGALPTPAGRTPLPGAGEIAAQSSPASTPDTTVPSTPLVTLPQHPAALDDLLGRLPTTEVDRVRQLLDALSTQQIDAFAAQVRGLAEGQVAALASDIGSRSAAGDLTGVVRILLAADVASVVTPAPSTTRPPATTQAPNTTQPLTTTTVPAVIGTTPIVPTVPSPATTLAPIIDDALNGLLGG